MRQAARNVEKEYSKTLTDAGFVVGRANGSTFYHEMREVRIVVHSDDFVITGWEEELKWTEDVLRKKYPLKMRGILGPEPGDSKEAIILHRCVRWRDDGVVFEADRAHVEKILEATRMADYKANTVPATKEKHPDVDVPLLGEQCKAFRSAVARANYLSQDRPDIRFATKELCRKMASPTVADWNALKKLWVKFSMAQKVKKSSEKCCSRWVVRFRMRATLPNKLSVSLGTAPRRIRRRWC